MIATKQSTLVVDLFKENEQQHQLRDFTDQPADPDTTTKSGKDGQVPQVDKEGKKETQEV